ncbi:hypothetical protein [Nitrobacter sp. TKz-YC02]|uniref:hypothetical protein n=1 Tax=Nitrobacter sp. TKz-YC02 TaxID=3398704 RepID=UPI003CF46DB5
MTHEILPQDQPNSLAEKEAGMGVVSGRRDYHRPPACGRAWFAVGYVVKCRSAGPKAKDDLNKNVSSLVQNQTHDYDDNPTPGFETVRAENGG